MYLCIVYNVRICSQPDWLSISISLSCPTQLRSTSITRCRLACCIRLQCVYSASAHMFATHLTETLFYETSFGAFTCFHSSVRFSSPLCVCRRTWTGSKASSLRHCYSFFIIMLSFFFFFLIYILRNSFSQFHFLLPQRNTTTVISTGINGEM